MKAAGVPNAVKAQLSGALDGQHLGRRQHLLEVESIRRRSAGSRQPGRNQRPRVAAGQLLMGAGTGLQPERLNRRRRLGPARESA